MPYLVQSRNNARLVIIAPQTNNSPIKAVSVLRLRLPFYIHSPFLLPGPAPQSYFLAAFFWNTLEALVVSRTFDLEIGDRLIEFDLASASIAAPKTDPRFGRVGRTEDVKGQPVGVCVVRWYSWMGVRTTSGEMPCQEHSVRPFMVELAVHSRFCPAALGTLFMASLR